MLLVAAPSSHVRLPFCRQRLTGSTDRFPASLIQSLIELRCWTWVARRGLWQDRGTGANNKRQPEASAARNAPRNWLCMHPRNHDVSGRCRSIGVAGRRKRTKALNGYIESIFKLLVGTLQDRRT